MSSVNEAITTNITQHIKSKVYPNIHNKPEILRYSYDIYYNLLGSINNIKQFTFS